MLKLKDLKEIDFDTDIYIYDTNKKLGTDCGDLSDKNIKKFGEYEVVSISPAFRKFEEGGIAIYINFFKDKEGEQC